MPRNFSVPPLSVFLNFVADFCLSLSREKSALWGTDPAGLKAIGERYGLVESDRITTLGMTWGLRPSSDPSSPKEEERIKEASLRLARLCSPVLAYTSEGEGYCDWLSVPVAICSYLAAYQGGKPKRTFETRSRTMSWNT